MCRPTGPSGERGRSLLMQHGIVATTSTEVDIDLSFPQFRVFRAKEWRRFRIVVAGRRFGKTVLALVELIRGALDEPGEYWYVAPTYRQAKLIAWRMLKGIVPSGAVRTVNETELFVEFVNGARISLKGADKGDSLRGVALRGVCLDEFASMNATVWSEVLRPALSDLIGWAVFIGSPAGHNHFFDLYERGLAMDEEFAEWFAWSFTTAEGGFVEEAEIEAARRELDPRVFRQEYMASFETIAGRVFYGFDRRVNVDPSVVDAGGTLEIGLDFNVDPMSAVVASKVGDELHVFDEIVLPNSNTFEMAEVIAERWGRRPLTDGEKQRIRQMGHIEGTTSVVDMARDIVVSPDASGNSRGTNAPVGVTDHGILNAYGLKVDSPSSNPPVKDRINHTNGMLRSAAGRARVLIHPRCKHTIKALDGHTWKVDANGNSTNIPDKSTGLDHLTDALGYLLCQRFGMPGAKSGTRRLAL